MRIILPDQPETKKEIARTILEGLPEWFGIESSREQYIRQSASQIMIAACGSNGPAGFLCLAPTSSAALEIVVMGVKKTWQHQGIGTLLIEQAKRWGRDHHYSFLHVKTVAEGWYEEYDQTNRFYQKCGFQKLEVLPDLWDENNPCQIYIMTIE